MLLAQPILTERLQLRPLARQDAAPDYLGWLRDPEILRYLEVRFAPAYDESSLGQFIEAVNASRDELLLGIVMGETGRHIGNIKLGPICAQHRRADLGFLIGDRREWGKGFATEAIAAVARHGLEHLGLAKVTSGCYASNLGSARALEKAGFVAEGRLRGHWIDRGVRVDGLLFAMFGGESCP